MNKIKIATIVADSNLKNFLTDLERIQKISDLVELRVDYIDNLQIKDLHLIKARITKEAIFTCRKKNEGGLFKGNEKERKRIIAEAIKIGFDYIDIELSTIKDWRPIIPNQIKLIISYHNFKKTPKLSVLKKIINEMKKFQPDIIKIATMSISEEDNRNLLRILLEKKEKEKMIILGMGEKGRITRILGPVLGSYLTYVATSFGQSAPGQMNIREMQNIYKSLLKVINYY